MRFLTGSAVCTHQDLRGRKCSSTPHVYKTSTRFPLQVCGYQARWHTIPTGPRPQRRAAEADRHTHVSVSALHFECAGKNQRRGTGPKSATIEPASHSGHNSKSLFFRLAPPPLRSSTGDILSDKGQRELSIITESQRADACSTSHISSKKLNTQRTPGA